MENKPSRQNSVSERKILGVSLSPEMALQVKSEAARRGVTVRKLFEEMWAQYKIKESNK